jgi:hypothetical protein
MAVGGGGSKDIYNYGILKLSRIMNLMGKEIGQSGAEMVVNVVCDDRPVNADELLILKLLDKEKKLEEQKIQQE